MASAAAPGTVVWPALRLRYEIVLPAVLLAAALILRAPHFGDPMLDGDEQWYLLVGDRLRHGALPYVDLWDRKPVGLFLLYAVLAWPGHEVIAYQLGATLAAAATAWTVARLATANSDRCAGAAAGLAYLTWIQTVGGEGGQSSVFYNLLVALAAEQVLAATAADCLVRACHGGMRAMLLIGLALQVKYTVVVEGAAFGLVLAASMWRRLPPVRWALHVATLAGVALAPTLAALLVYAAQRHLGDFWFANFRSILLRTSDDPAAVRLRLGQIAVQFAAFVPCWLVGLRALGSADAAVRRRQRLVLGWLLAAIGGFACVGTFFFHYALPLFVPACVLAAPAFGPKPLGRALAAALIWLPLHSMHLLDRGETLRHQRELARMAALLPASVERRCLAVLDGPAMLYLATHACVPTRFAFSGHLLSAMETNALGVDRAAEIERVFARAPAAVAISRAPYDPDPASAARIVRHLRADYRLAGSAVTDGQEIDILVRR